MHVIVLSALILELAHVYKLQDTPSWNPDQIHHTFYIAGLRDKDPWKPAVFQRRCAPAFLHGKLPFSDLFPIQVPQQKEKAPILAFFFLLRDLDSNQDEMLQRHLSYH